MQRASGAIPISTHPSALRAIEELQENAAAGKEGFLILRAEGEQLVVEHHCQAVHVVLPNETKEVNTDLAGDALGDLPLEIKMHILSHMPPAAVANCARVSQAWRSLASHPMLWRQKLQSEFPSTFIRGAAPNTYRHIFHAKTWRDAYLFLARRFSKTGFMQPTFQQMRALLPANACRVVLFNLACDFGGEFRMLSVYLVWAPDHTGVKERMHYVTFATGLKAAKVMKIDLEAQASELAEVSLEELQDNIQRKLHAGAVVRGVDPSRFVLRM